MYISFVFQQSNNILQKYLLLFFLIKHDMIIKNTKGRKNDDKHN